MLLVIAANSPSIPVQGLGLRCASVSWRGLTREAFKESKLDIKMDMVDDGEKCMAYLRKQGPYLNAPTPDLILLDINLPVMDGREVLAEILKDGALRSLPVVILTTSESDSGLMTMYNLRCSFYLKNPSIFINSIM